MIYEYRVVHAVEMEDAEQPDHQKALPLSKVFAHYALFCSAVVEHFSSKPSFSASCLSSEHKENGVEVFMTSMLEEPTVRNMLASFLVQMNRATVGMRLMLEPENSADWGGEDSQWL